MIIVIDGPAGSGKSSTAKAVAEKLNIEYLDSGALYRALTYYYMSESFENFDSFFESLNNLTVTFKYEDTLFRVWIENTEVTGRLRLEEVSDLVSVVAAKPQVRNFVNSLMRQAVKNGVYIAEGRDLGTAVFPDAELKFFMVASVDIRAERRFEQLKQKGVQTSLQAVKQNIRQRDKTDSQRTSDPLKKSDSAIEINTTDLTFEQQVQKICSIIEQELKLKS